MWPANAPRPAGSGGCCVPIRVSRRGLPTWRPRENACCAFMTNTVSVVGEHVHWDASVIDDAAARAVLNLLFELPGRRRDSPEGLYREWNTLGVPILVQDDGIIRPATEAEALTGCRKPLDVGPP